MPAGSVPYGSTRALTAVVEGLSPTGDVTFYAGDTALATVQLTSGSATLRTSDLAIGTHTIIARYSGEAAYAPSEVSVDVIVTSQNPQITITPPAQPLDALTDVSASFLVTDDAGNPLSDRQLSVKIYKEGSSEPAKDFRVAINRGYGGFSIPSLPHGTYRLVASLPETSVWFEAEESVGFVVDPIQPTLTLTDSGTAIYGSTRTFTATVVGGSATGAVAFSAAGVYLGPGSISHDNRVATFTIDSFPIGTHTIDAFYPGDSRHAPASASMTITVAPWTSTVVLTPSDTDVQVGDDVTARVVVTLRDATRPDSGGAARKTASGTVQLLVDGDAVGGAVALADGEATLPVPTTVAGSASISAAFTPIDDTMLPAVSDAHDLEVAALEATVTLSSSPTAVHGSDRTFIATLTGENPTGDVVFTRDGDVLAIVPVVDGVATLVTDALTVGTHTIEAAYSGDARHAAASASTTATVNAWASAVTVTPSSTDVFVGDPLMLTVDVVLTDPSVMTRARAAGAPVAASGTIELLIGGIVTGAPMPLVDGSAVVTVPTTTAGDVSVVARFVPADSSMSAAESVSTVVSIAPTPTPTLTAEPTPEPTPTAEPPLAATGTADTSTLLLGPLLLIAGAALATGRRVRREHS